MTWEQRWHPLREEWIIIAAHRQNRPWVGERVNDSKVQIPEYDPDCTFCPGNLRISQERNPSYTQTFVFNNDHPCVSWDAPIELESVKGPNQNMPARGIARVLCYSPKHNLTLAELSIDETMTLIGAWQEQYHELGNHPKIHHVLIFENKGEVVGVSNPHPHCQIYATNFVFKTIETEARVSQKYLKENGRNLFQDIIAAEREDGRRIICENESAIGFIPYFARYAYEVYVAPKNAVASISELSDDDRVDFARILKQVLVKLDNLWQMSFPYVMVLHQAPTDGGEYTGFHFHVEFHPPLQTPNLLKYLAGPEIGGGNFLSDTSPEEKAAELRGQPDTHYRIIP